MARPSLKLDISVARDGAPRRAVSHQAYVVALFVTWLSAAACGGERPALTGPPAADNPNVSLTDTTTQTTAQSSTSADATASSTTSAASNSTSSPASGATSSPTSSPTSGAATAAQSLHRSNILYGVTSDISWYNDPAYRTTAVTAARSLNAKVMRVGLFWMWIEYYKGKRDWSVPDHIVNSLTAAGIKPIFNVMGSPEWESGVSEASNEYFYLYVPQNSVAFQRWVTDYANFITAAAQRYKGKVTMWELGNEVNDAWFWRPQPDVAQYATWFTALRTAIKQVDPTALVASGGLNGLADNLDAPGIGARAFLKGLYTRNVFPDFVAIHPYSNMGQSPNVHLAQEQVTNFDDIAMMHEFMVANGQGSHPLWITEWGWSLDNVSAAVQADYVTKSLNLLESTYSSYVTVATYYSEFDPASTYRYGLYTKDFVARPAATAFKTFMTGR